MQTDHETATTGSSKSYNTPFELSNKKMSKFFPPNFLQSDNPCARQKTPFNQSRYLILLCCTIYVSFTGSVYYGWPGFSNMLFRDGAYRWLCPEGSFIDDRRYDCEEQDTAVQRLFQIAMPCQYIMSLVAGTFIDNFGPKFTAVLGQSINFTAWLLLSFAGENFNAYVFCFAMIGLGADTGFLPTLQTSNLFPGYNGVVIAILGAANSASFAVPTIMDAIQRGYNLTFQQICYGYMAILAIMWLYAALFMPTRSFYPLEYYTLDGSAPIIKSQKTGITKLWEDIKGLPKNLAQSYDQFTSSRFIAISFYFCTTCLIFNFFTVSGEQLLTTEVNTFYGIINPISFAPTIVYGKLVDSIGPVYVMFINTTFGFVAYILANIPSIATKYAASVCMTIYVSIYTSQVYFFIKDRFEDLHFGKLVGVASMCGGVVSLLSVYLYDPLTKETFNENYLYVSIMMMVLCVFNYFSFHFMRGHSRLMEQKKMRN